MKQSKVLFGFGSGLALLATLVFSPSSQAAEVQIGNLVVTLPDTINVTGQETGLSKRNCNFKVSVNAAPGTAIPLRGGIVLYLSDSLNGNLDNGYALTDVDGMTHLDVTMVSHCDGVQGTLKPPYFFHLTPRGLPNVNPFIDPVPVTLNFSQSVPTPSRTPTPNVSPLEPSPSPDIGALTANKMALVDENRQLKNRIRNLQLQLKKICSIKPKPKEC